MEALLSAAAFLRLGLSAMRGHSHKSIVFRSPAAGDGARYDEAGSGDSR
jgi:hypothetical protein